MIPLASVESLDMLIFIAIGSTLAAIIQLAVIIRYKMQTGKLVTGRYTVVIKLYERDTDMETYHVSGCATPWDAVVGAAALSLDVDLPAAKEHVDKHPYDVVVFVGHIEGVGYAQPR